MAVLEGTFVLIKVGHLNDLFLLNFVKEEKEKLYFQPVFAARVLQELKAVKFFPLPLVFALTG